MNSQSSFALRLAVASLFALLPASAVAQSEPPVRAFVGARLLPIRSAPIDDGVIVVREGRIAAVGARASVAIPEGAEVVDLAGRLLMPGLICTHSHVGAP